MKLHTFLLTILVIILASCTSIPPYTPGEITAVGTMNRVNYKDYDYWIFETKIDKNKEFIELLGNKSDLKKIQIEGQEVTLRILPKPDRKPEIKMASSSALLLEIVQPK
jgi:hypothetical protein